MSVNLIYSLIERMENTLTGAIKLLPLLAR